MKTIHITEEQAKKVKKSIAAQDQVGGKVNSALLCYENSSHFIETWYRGFKSKFGPYKNHLIWLTDDISYAKSYGNRVYEYKINMSKCDGCISDLEEMCEYDFDYLEGPDIDLIETALQNGINSYEFYANNDDSICMCLWDKSPIISIRELDEEEYNNIEEYEGLEYSSYNDVDENADYMLGSEGGNNDYFHVTSVNEGMAEKIEKFLRLQAKEIYGITDSFEKAGFILTTGELLDLSNGKEKISMYHGALDVNGSNLREFLAAGNVRVQFASPGIEFVKKPTEQQFNQIKNFVRYTQNRESFYVDCCNEEGNNIWSKEYKGPQKESIYNDIVRYFDEGIKPQIGNSVLNGYSLADFLGESTKPSDVDLSSFNIKKNLNPKFWKDGHLDSRIRMKLLDIADDFIEFLGIDWVEPEDIIMTGSLANYSWDEKYSDIDLHIVVDYSDVDKRKDFVDNYFYSQKSLWNNEHKDLKIFGFPVEVFVQDVNTEHDSSGAYSLDKDKWITEPTREKLAKAKVNKDKIRAKVSEYMNDIDELCDIYKRNKSNEYKVRKVSEDADELFEKIKKERKEGLTKTGNEINNGNIIFKTLRRNGYIKKIIDLKSKTYDKMNSLS